MAINIQMPALSPTMEEGTLAKWLVKEGDSVKSGDLLAEIETDKATMEFEAVDEGVIGKIMVAAGTEGVKVGTVIATLVEEGEDASAASPSAEPTPAQAGPAITPAPQPLEEGRPSTPAQNEAVRTEPVEVPSFTSVSENSLSTSSGRTDQGNDRVKASPLARRLAEQGGINLAGVKGSGPDGRIVKADLDGAAKAPVAVAAPAPAASAPSAAPAPAPSTPTPAPAPAAAQDFGIPHTAEKLSGMRKTIARRLTEAKQTIPHIYLTVDVRLDALLKLRTELNAALEKSGVKLSVNDLLIKALAKALLAVPKCNVQFAGDQLLSFHRADISVAVSVPAGLITPIIVDAGSKAVSAISTEMKALAGKAKEGKLQPHEYQGGTASLSNMGMFGIKQFEAVINPPQGMIMAIGAGEKRPFVIDDALAIATVMSATGSFDHRAIDGADGAQLMQAFRELVEMPLGLVA